MTDNPPTRDEIGDRLAKLANHLMDRILDPDNKEKLAIEQETSAFKAITNYYAMLKKLEPPNSDEKPFNGWKDKIPSVVRGGGIAANGVSDTSENSSEDLDF